MLDSPVFLIDSIRGLCVVFNGTRVVVGLLAALDFTPGRGTLFATFPAQLTDKAVELQVSF